VLAQTTRHLVACKLGDLTRENLTVLIRGIPALHHLSVIGNCDFGHMNHILTLPVGGRCQLQVRVTCMNVTSHINGLIATCAALLIACNSQAAESVVTPAMVGHWEGNARIVVSWCHQKNLSVKVDIYADGTVTGAVGDAKLSEGHFESNRGWLFRKWNWATDYIITGGLDGSIVAAEGITRSRVKMPLNFSGGTFAGGVNTSGSGFEGFDGKKGEGTWLAAGGLRLTRSQ
jgi:hypothetical protein